MSAKTCFAKWARVSIDDLFKGVPQKLKLNRPLDLQPALSDSETLSTFSISQQQNSICRRER
jgi:hypothetical protein